MLWLLDYGAGNVKSLANTIEKLGFEYRWVNQPEDIDSADASQPCFSFICTDPICIRSCSFLVLALLAQLYNL